MNKNTPLPAILDPTPEMPTAFQRGFVDQLHRRHQVRFKPPAAQTARQRESAEVGGLRAMLGAMPEAHARMIDAAPELLELLLFIEAGMSMPGPDRHKRWPEWAALEDEAERRFKAGKRGSMVYAVADAIYHWARLPLIRAALAKAGAA